MKKRHDPENERWWVTYFDDEGREINVTFRWSYLGNGVYAVVPNGVTFDLFIPLHEQEALLETLQRMKVRTVSDAD